MLDHPSVTAAMSELSPQSRARLTTYIREAEFFLPIIQSDLHRLPAGSRVLELGSGIGLLAMSVAQQGLRVTAVEPMSGGFGVMAELREVVTACWDGPVPHVDWVSGTAEDLPEADHNGFEYGYAINVLEHVPDIAQFLHSAHQLLQPGRGLRFICPNYNIPYEPHLNSPTLFTKRASAPLARRVIARRGEPHLHDLWDELSWPTPRSVRRACPAGASLAFSADATAAYLQRGTTDPDFRQRKGPILGAVALGLNSVPRELLDSIPPAALPVIDGRLVKQSAQRLVGSR